MTAEFIDALDYSTSHKYIEHVRKVEEVFRVADVLVEEDTECNITDLDSDQVQDIEEDTWGVDDDDDGDGDT